MSAITQTQLENAAADADTLASLINGTGTVTARLGGVLKTYAQIAADYAAIAGTSATGFNVDSGNHTVGLNCTPIAASATMMRLQANGSADVGLELIRISSSEFCILSYNRTSSAYKTLRLDGANYTFALNGTAIGGIDTSGNMLVGLTSPIGGSAHNLLTTISGFGLCVTGNHASTPQGVLVRYGAASPNGTASEFLYCTDSTTARAKILSNGNLVNANNSYGAISDSKLKQDIVLADSQWDDLKALSAKVSKFHFKTDPTGPLLLGLIAQDVELISPGLVEETADKDSDGTDLGTTTKGVKYSVLYMKAIKALGEAQTRIETLEAALTAITARVTALETP